PPSSSSLFPTRRSSDLFIRFRGIVKGAVAIFVIVCGIFDAVQIPAPDERVIIRKGRIDVIFGVNRRHANVELFARFLGIAGIERSEEHTSELQSRENLV